MKYIKTIQEILDFTTSLDDLRARAVKSHYPREDDDHLRELILAIKADRYKMAVLDDKNIPNAVEDCLMNVNAVFSGFSTRFVSIEFAQLLVKCLANINSEVLATLPIDYWEGLVNILYEGLSFIYYEGFGFKNRATLCFEGNSTILRVYPHLPQSAIDALLSFVKFMEETDKTNEPESLIQEFSHENSISKPILPSKEVLSDRPFFMEPLCPTFFQKRPKTYHLNKVYNQNDENLANKENMPVSNNSSCLMN